MKTKNLQALHVMAKEVTSTFRIQDSMRFDSLEIKKCVWQWVRSLIIKEMLSTELLKLMSLWLWPGNILRKVRFLTNFILRCKGHLHQNRDAPSNQYWIFEEESGRIYNPTSHLCVTMFGPEAVLKDGCLSFILILSFLTRTTVRNRKSHVMVLFYSSFDGQAF